MLIVLVALVAIANAALALLPALDGAPVTLQRLLGYAMAPVAWLIGIPAAEAGAAGALLGTKVVLNELIAYLDLARLPDGALSDRSRLILTYAMCGFANFASLGIMIGGLGAMAPDRRAEVVALGLRSIAAGVMTTCLTAALVGLIL
jgi:CNT family concentrative nucleoside transporter